METSEFSDSHFDLAAAEPLKVSSGTSRCYRVKLYGKQHFLKLLKPELRNDPRYVAAMRKEFETGYNLEHPHLVRYVACSNDYLLTEWIDGVTLREFAQVNPAFFKSRNNVARLVGELLDVVEYLHSHQIVHLDLKPDNILITRIGNELKLTDLGFCYTDTFTDTMGRTSSFAAPEQLDGSVNVDQRTDIYAIGRIIAMLPCATHYRNIIALCTRCSKDDRYQSVAELRKELTKPHTKVLLITTIVAIVVAVALVIWLTVPSTSTTRKETKEPSSTVHTATITAEPATITAEPATITAEPVTITAEPETNTAEPGTSDTPPAIDEKATTKPVIATPVQSSSPIVTKSPANTTQSKPITINEETLFNELSAATRPIYNKYLKQYKDIDVLDTCYMKAKSQCEREIEAMLHRLYQTKYKPMGVDEREYGAVAVRIMYQL